MDQVLDLETVESIRELNLHGVGGGFALELLAVFAKQSALMIEGLEAATTRRNLAEIKRIAHRLKGSAANIGAGQLACQAAGIEARAQAEVSDLANLSAEVRALAGLRERSMLALSRYFS